LSAWNARRLIARRAVWLVLLLAARATAQPQAAGTPEEALREEFAVAYAAAQLGNDRPEDDSRALERYVLYPYLRAARLSYALSRVGGDRSDADDDTERFLKAHRSEPVAASLHQDWLESLARREQWKAFLEHYDESVASDALGCQRLNARIALGQTADLEPLVVERWLTPRRLPPECEKAFEWLRGRAGLDEVLVAERVRRLLENGQASFARIIARRLPEDRAKPFDLWADLIEKPADAIDALIADPTADVDVEHLLDGFARLARNSPREALKRFDALRAARLTEPEARSRAARALALGLAWDRDEEALPYFGRIAPADLDDDVLEWLARSASWNGDWNTTRNAIASMSPARQNEAAWRYWTGRAAEALDEDAIARGRYESLLGDDNYYSGVAAARLGQRVAPHVERFPADDDAIDRIARQPPFVRARELALCGLRSLATLEWRAGYTGLDESLKPQAIHLASRWELHDIAVATATSQGVFNDYELLYPRPFGKEVAVAVELTKVDPPLLYGVLRQESLFRPDATSIAGALGLAQLGYSTAEITASRWQLPRPSREELYDPETNIRLGAARLATLIEKYSGELPVALAAYNAGERAAERWLPPQPIDSDVWIENIPYNETRAYVRRVLWHSLVFGWLVDGRPRSTQSWLDRVSPP